MRPAPMRLEHGAFRALSGGQHKEPRRTGPRGASREIGGGQNLVNWLEFAAFCRETILTPLLAVPRHPALQTACDCASVRRRSQGHYPGPKDRFMKLLSFFAPPAFAGASLAVFA